MHLWEKRMRVNRANITCSVQFSSVQSLSRVQLFATPWIAACQASLSITNSGVHSDSHPSSRWCHPAFSSSVVPFSSCPQSLQASESFPMSQLFAWGGQSTGVSALASFLPKKSQGWSPSEWTCCISLQSKGLSRVFSNTTVQKHQFFGAQPSSQSNSHIHTPGYPGVPRIPKMILGPQGIPRPHFENMWSCGLDVAKKMWTGLSLQHRLYSRNSTLAILFLEDPTECQSWLGHITVLGDNNLHMYHCTSGPLTTTTMAQGMIIVSGGLELVTRNSKESNILFCTIKI